MNDLRQPVMSVRHKVPPSILIWEEGVFFASFRARIKSLSRHRTLALESGGKFSTALLMCSLYLRFWLPETAVSFCFCVGFMRQIILLNLMLKIHPKYNFSENLHYFGIFYSVYGCPNLIFFEMLEKFQSICPSSTENLTYDWPQNLVLSY